MFAVPCRERDFAERQRYVEVLNASLQLTKAELTLLRATGGIEDWVNLRTHTP